MSSLASSKIAATRDGVAFTQILDVHDAAEKRNNLLVDNAEISRWPGATFSESFIFLQTWFLTSAEDVFSEDAT